MMIQESLVRVIVMIKKTKMERSVSKGKKIGQWAQVVSNGLGCVFNAQDNTRHDGTHDLDAAQTY